MRQSKTALISDYFSARPSYSRYSRKACYLWVIALVLALWGLILVLFNGGIFGGGLERSGYCSLASFSLSFIFAIVGVVLFIQKMSLEHKARVFIKERIRSEQSELEKIMLTEHPSNFAAAEPVTIIGYTSAAVNERRARFWQDDFKCLYSTNIEIAIFIALENALHCCKSEFCLDKLSCSVRYLYTLPYNQISEVKRIYQKFECLVRQKTPMKGIYERLVINGDGFSVSTSLTYYDTIDSLLDRCFIDEVFKISKIIETSQIREEANLAMFDLMPSDCNENKSVE